MAALVAAFICLVCLFCLLFSSFLLLLILLTECYAAFAFLLKLLGGFICENKGTAVLRSEILSAQLRGPLWA